MLWHGLSYDEGAELRVGLGLGLRLMLGLGSAHVVKVRVRITVRVRVRGTNMGGGVSHLGFPVVPG